MALEDAMSKAHNELTNQWQARRKEIEAFYRIKWKESLLVSKNEHQKALFDMERKLDREYLGLMDDKVTLYFSVNLLFY